MQSASHSGANRASLPRAARTLRSRSVHPFERLTTYATVSTNDGEDNEFERQHAWTRLLPPVDINRAIPFSWVRCIMSIASFMLLVTDIPRSGLGIKTTAELYPHQTAPDTSLFFEPEPYPVAHITCHSYESGVTASTSLNCSGWEGSEPIEVASAWSYGYDTTSIGMRAFAELFSPPNFPDFLLERGTDPRLRESVASIELDTVFRMLDGFVSVAQQAIDAERSKTTLRRLWFASQYHWIDRLHQYVMRQNLQNLRWRLHSLHSRSSSPDSDSGSEELWRPVCASPSAVGQRGTAFATFAECEHFVRWRCQHPQNSSLGMISIAEHLPTRLHMLQQKYPGLWMDTVVVAAQETVTASSLLSHGILHSLDTSEVVVLTRGRNCSRTRTATGGASKANTTTECTTVFVDDYRYERNMITSNVPDWFFVTATLRGSAQVYVWLRLVLLAYISYTAQPRRLRSARLRASSALVSIFKIPFQVVVYGSIIPTVLYVCAFFIDINFIESKLDSLWSTARGGYSNIDKLAFIRACTMQMRNVWLLALLAKLPVLLQTRDSRWRPHMGIRGVRGLAIGFASMLSIFGPYRSLSFRNSANVSVILLGRQYDTGRFGGLKNEQGMAPNQLPLPVGPSLMMTVLAIIVMIALDGTLRLASWVFHRDWRGHEILFGSSILVPHSAGRLWPITALAIRFNLVSTAPFAGGRHRPAPASPVGRSSSVSPARPRRTKESSPTRRDVHRRVEPPQHTVGMANQVNFTNADRRRSIDVCNRSDGVRAVIQLMNVTMMSDPWTLFQLRVIGVKLFVYRVCAVDATASDTNADGEETSLAILPYAPNEVSEWTGLTEAQIHLVDIVDSSEVPLALLLQSG